MRNEPKLLLLPVSRRLMCAAMAYLAGIALSAYGVLPAQPAAALCGVLLLLGAWRLRAGKRALLLISLALMVWGNAAAGWQLACRDEPTAPKTVISGRIAALESDSSDYRVRLDDVRLPGGEETRRPVVVTLMTREEESAPAPPRVGQRVLGTGRLFAQEEVRNPGGYDRRIAALNAGYELSGYLLPGWTLEGEGRFSLRSALRDVRLALIRRVEALFGGDAPLFLAVMLGDRSQIDGELTAALRLTGTAHILSVSGMHLHMVSAMMWGVLRALRAPKRAARWMLSIALLLFAALTGFAVGTVRALIMTLLRLYARAHGRRYDRLTALAAAALAMTIVRPLLLFDGGFRFSFFVVLGMTLLHPPIASLRPFVLLSRRLPRVCDALTLALSAQLSAVPMQLMLYGYVPLLSLPMNLLCSLLIPFVMAGGWLVLASSFLLPGAALLPARGIALFAGLFESGSLLAAGIRGGIVRLPSPGEPVLVLLCLAAALLGAKVSFGCMRRQALCAALALALALYLPRFDGAERYVQLDVGQGDASVIRLGRHAVIVDVGPADSYDLLRYLRHEGLFVDAVILSHLDEDHAGALGTLLSSEIDVKRVIMADGAWEEMSSEAVAAGLSLLNEKGAALETVIRGDVFSCGGASFSVLSPDGVLSGSNERSLLLDARAAGRTLLLTGDLPLECEPEAVPDCDVIKVAHHGSKNATSEAFIAMAKPEIAIISAGANNSYGHPHARVLEDLAAAGAAILRTDQSGCISVDLSALRADVYKNAPAMQAGNGGGMRE